MKIKRILVILLAVIMSTSFCIVTQATESRPQFAITDDTVIIDYVSYQIIDNSIEFNGTTYTIVNYKLISYDDAGQPTILFIPIEQNKVTDPVRIAELNASIGIQSPSQREIPSNPVNLPYSDSVPTGQYMTQTPAFNAIVSNFYYYTNLQLSNFPLFADRRFLVVYSFCGPDGVWHSDYTEQDFLYLVGGTLKIQNLSSYRYGRFHMTNLYGDPSPSYSYSIYLSNI